MLIKSSIYSHLGDVNVSVSSSYNSEIHSYGKAKINVYINFNIEVVNELHYLQKLLNNDFLINYLKIKTVLSDFKTIATVVNFISVSTVNGNDKVSTENGNVNISTINEKIKHT